MILSLGKVGRIDIAFQSTIHGVQSDGSLQKKMKEIRKKFKRVEEDEWGKKCSVGNAVQRRRGHSVRKTWTK